MSAVSEAILQYNWNPELQSKAGCDIMTKHFPLGDKTQDANLHIQN
jgi:hypothetical protein